MNIPKGFFPSIFGWKIKPKKEKKNLEHQWNQSFYAQSIRRCGLALPAASPCKSPGRAGDIVVIYMKYEVTLVASAPCYYVSA